MEISLYAPIYAENSDVIKKETLADIINRKNEANPEELVIDKENTHMIEYELVRRLSHLRKQALKEIKQ
ncbi:MAG: hypothetical protein WBI07_01095 [Mobilitalea sp.]